MKEQLLTDPREMRQVIEKLSWGRTDIHGNERDLMKIPITAAMVRNLMEHARRTGLSGEDLYTLLAYHAMVMAESMGAQLIEQASHSLVPASFVMRYARENIKDNGDGTISIRPPEPYHLRQKSNDKAGSE